MRNRRLALVMVAPLLAVACGSSLDESLPRSPSTNDEVITFDDIAEQVAETAAMTPTETVVVAPAAEPSRLVVEVESGASQPVVMDLPDLRFADYEDWGFVGPFVAYGQPEAPDPFAHGDLHLSVVFSPHTDDSHVTDGSTGTSTESSIAGRTAQLIPWRAGTSGSDVVGHEILWDADPDHYVLARSRSLPLDRLIELVATVTIADGVVSVDHEAFGLAPIDAGLGLLSEPGRQLAHLDGTVSVHRMFGDDGSIGDLHVWMLDADSSELLGWRFLAGTEREVRVRGVDGHLLEGLASTFEDVSAAVVWIEPDGRLGLAGVDDEAFADALPGVVDGLELDG